VAGRMSAILMGPGRCSPSSRLPTEDELSDPRRWRLLHRGDDVAVGLERDGDVCLPENLGDDLGVLAGLERQRRPGVPEVVEPDAWQPAGGDPPVEHARHRFRIEGCAVYPAEDQIAVLVLGDAPELALRCSLTTASVEAARGT
jgi:hypothetical protein